MAALPPGDRRQRPRQPHAAYGRQQPIGRVGGNNRVAAVARRSARPRLADRKRSPMKEGKMIEPLHVATVGGQPRRTYQVSQVLDRPSRRPRAPPPEAQEARKRLRRESHLAGVFGALVRRRRPDSGSGGTLRFNQPSGLSALAVAMTSASVASRGSRVRRRCEGYPNNRASSSGRPLGPRKPISVPPFFKFLVTRAPMRRRSRRSAFRARSGKNDLPAPVLQRWI
jgi:hypothetical protein